MLFSRFLIRKKRLLVSGGRWLKFSERFIFFKSLLIKTIVFLTSVNHGKRNFIYLIILRFLNTENKHLNLQKYGLQVWSRYLG